MIHLFCGKAAQIYVAQNKSDRAATAEAQSKAVAKCGLEAIVCPSVAEALKLALLEAGEDGVIVAGGSLYTVGEVISAYGGLCAKKLNCISPISCHFWPNAGSK
ncbi:MAG: hypothetical protein LRZ88_10720 [Candidatus Cloacimonetes bacterium]|nr:hypothetical protein [Candidatus Cloacimonadota bacterium]